MSTFYRALVTLLLSALTLAGCGETPSVQQLATPVPPRVEPTTPATEPIAAPSPAPSTPTTTAQDRAPLAATLNTPFQLRASQPVAAIESERLEITFAAVAEDSRCPTSVMCAWMGQARVVVALAKDGRDLGQFELTLYGTSAQAEDSVKRVEDYTMSFVKFEPYPVKIGELSFSSYVATFLVQPASSSATGAHPYEQIKTAEFEGAIVPQEQGAAFDRGIGRVSGADGYWTPQKDQVLKLEESTQVYLRQTAPVQSPNLWEKLSQYKRQYLGILRDGRLKIYTNFFCGDDITDWREQPVLVLDGGDCFFHMVYDLDTGTFSELSINGEA